MQRTSSPADSSTPRGASTSSTTTARPAATAGDHGTSRGAKPPSYKARPRAPKVR